MKPRYRYNWKTRKRVQVYRVDAGVVEISGFVDPITGMRKLFWPSNRIGMGVLS